MTNARVLVVEDEAIVAMDIESKLQRLGYSVVAVARSGEEAIRRAGQTNPDLVLMDINLGGDMDGIEAAAGIRNAFNVPAIYVTAHADPETLQRAKVTEPLGYIVKPFEEADLRAAVEMALYRHRLTAALNESDGTRPNTPHPLGDAVITTDTDGYATFLNPVACALTGWKQDQAMGQELTNVFKIEGQTSSELCEHPVTKVLKGSLFDLAIDKVLVTRDGSETPIDYNAAPIKDERGNITGVVLVFRPTA